MSFGGDPPRDRGSRTSGGPFASTNCGGQGNDSVVPTVTLLREEDRSGAGRRRRVRSTRVPSRTPPPSSVCRRYSRMQTNLIRCDMPQTLEPSHLYFFLPLRVTGNSSLSIKMIAQLWTSRAAAPVDSLTPSRATAAHDSFVGRASKRRQSSISICRHSRRDGQAPRT